MSFQVTESPGPRCPASKCFVDSSVLNYLLLFWSDDIWKLMVDNASYDVKTAKPADYYAKLWQPLEMTELKGFVGM